MYNQNSAGMNQVSAMPTTDMSDLSRYVGTNPNQQISTGPQKQKGNWFERLLPTLGGIAGGVLGGAADVASLGTLAPLINPITGAAAGQALGKFGENLFTGESAGKGVLQEGIAGGTGALVGGALGKGVSALGGLAEKTGAGMLTKAATQEAESLVPTAVSQAEKDLAETAKTKANFGVMNRKVQTSLDLGGSQVKARQLGLDPTDPKSLLEIGKTSGAYDRVRNEALQQAPAVDTGKLFKGLTNVTAGNSTFEAPVVGKSGQLIDIKTNQAIRDLTPEGQKLLTDLTGAFNDAGINAKNTIVARSSVNKDVPSLQKGLSNVGKLIDKTHKELNTGIPGQENPIAVQKLDILNKVYNDTKTLLHDHPSIDKYIANKTLTPAEEKVIRAEITNPATAQSAIDTINKASNKDSLLKELQTATNANKAGKMAQKDIETAVGTTAAKERAKIALQEAQTAAGGTPPPPIQPSEAANTLSTVAPKLGAIAKGFNAAAQSPATAKGLKKFGPVLERAGKFGAPAGAAVSSLGGLVAAPVGGANMNQQQQGTGAQQQPITQLFKQLLAQEQAGAGLTDNSGALLSALQALAGPAQQTQMLGQAQQGLQQGFQNAGGPQGLLGGALTNLTGLIPGTAANQYQRNQGVYGSLMQQLYGIPAGQAGAATPQFTQTPGTAGIAGGLAGI